MINLKEITIKDKPVFDSSINYSYENSEASFANIFIWRKISKSRYALINDAVCVFYVKTDGREACCFPLGKCDLEDTVLQMKKHFDNLGKKFIMESVPQENKNQLLEVFGDKLIVCETPDLFDYVYKTDKLINLSGKKLHAKRNHINKFKSLYSYKYEVLENSMFDECLMSCKNWLLKKYLPSDSDYKSEMSALTEIFTYYDDLNLTGGAITVNDKIVAFTIGEKLNNNTFVTHIEKADTDYQGSYTVINNEFAINACSEFEFINREEDMGIEGIRKAKQSYFPDKLIKKYRIEFKE